MCGGGIRNPKRFVGAKREGGPEGATKENSYVMKFGLRVCQRNNSSVGLCVAGARVAGFVQGTQEQ